MASRTRGLVKSLHQPEQQALCELLIEARRKAGLTQERLAKQLKRPQSFVAKYERGERRLDVIEFVAIAECLGADPAKLLRKLLGKIA
jgi:transcriptional regulator with XRE-family HTH domain